MNSLPLAAIGDFLGIIIFIIVAIVSALSKRNQTEDGPTFPRRQAPPEDLSDEMRKFLDQARKASQPKSEPPPILPSAPPPLPAPQRQRVPQHQGYQKKIVKHIPTVQQAQRTFSKSEKTAAPASKVDLLKELQVDVPVKVDVLHEPVAPPLPDEPLLDVHTKFEAPTKPGPASEKLSASYFRTPSNVRQAILLMEVLGKPRAVSPYQGPEM
jgi:hypothetical protein